MDLPRFIDSRSGLRGQLVDADTREPIRWVRWADLLTGEFEAFSIDPEEAKRRHIPLRLILIRGRRRKLEFVTSFAPTLTPSYTPKPATPLAEIKREVLKGREVKALLILPGVRGPECDEPKCHREAGWQVSDTIEVEPETGADGKSYARAITTRVRNYCPYHYRPPTRANLRGVITENEKAARPQ